ncbi:hypothetical protein BDV06DRAFT_235842 [Aspergillus oleicola]
MPKNPAFAACEYTVGIICALDKELLAVRCLMDSIHPDVLPGRRDTNSYIWGTMVNHTVVATCLPAGEYGTNAAASVASQMRISFPAVEFCLLVGVAGGTPGKKDIRLGDVVVSLPESSHPGVLQYDLGKAMPEGRFVETGSLQRPPRVLLGAINKLRSNPNLATNPLQPYVDIITQKRPAYRFPRREHDILFQPDCIHNAADTTCDNHLHFQMARAARTSDYPHIHYGLIASGNKVVRDAGLRDRLGRKYGILCFEMEAAGVLNALPCLVIRGICDYSDSHKSNLWQGYAAATAAAYAKLLLTEVRGYYTSYDDGTRSFDGTNDSNVVTKVTCNKPISADSSGGYDSSHNILNGDQTTANRQQDQDPGNNPLPTDAIQPPTTSRDPKDILHKAQSYAERRQSWITAPMDAVPLLDNVKKWAESSNPAVLIVEPQGQAAESRAEDFAFETIKFLKAQDQPIIWALQPAFDEPLTFHDITQCIIRQIQQSHGGSATTAQHHRTNLLDPLPRVFELLHKSFIVLQVKESSLVLQLLHSIHLVCTEPNRRIKLLLISYCSDVSHLAASFSKSRTIRLSPPPPARKRKRQRERYWESIQPRL